MAEETQEAGMALTGAVLLRTDADATPDWIFHQGTLIGMGIGEVGDFGIVKETDDPNTITVTSLTNRKKRVYRRADVAAKRPLLVIPALELRELKTPVEGGWYLTSTGRCVRLHKRHWVDEVGVPVRLPFVPHLVVMREPTKAAKDSE